MSLIDDFIEQPPLYPDQTEETIRARWDAWANEGLTPDQVDEWTDTREGGFFFINTQPGVRECARIYDLMGTEVPAAANPVFAWDEYLDNHAAAVGLERRAATYAEGTILLTALGQRNEVQTLSHDATGGSVLLQWNGVTTSIPLVWNATASDVKSQLETIAGIGRGNVKVTGGPWPAEITVEFVGALGWQDVAEIEVASGGNALTPGGSTVTITTASEGVAPDSPITLPAGFTVGVEPVDEDADALEFQTLDSDLLNGPLPIPGAPTLSQLTSGGALAAGTYGYVLTWVDDAGETARSNATNITTSGAFSRVIVDLPAVPDGVKSFRVYRGPSGGPYNFLAEVARPAVQYIDTGAATTGVVSPTTNSTGGKRRVAVRAAEAGSAFNVSAGAITQIISAISDDAVAVTNEAPIVGGTDTETDDSLRDRIIGRFGASGAGTIADYKRWALEEPGVGRVSVIPLWNGAGTVKVIITDPNGDPVAASVVTSLQNRLDPVPGQGAGLAPIGAVVTVSTATGLTVKVDATVEFEPGYSLDGTGGTVAIGAVIDSAVRAYVEGIESGGEVVRTQVMAVILSIPGVHDISPTSVELNDAQLNVPVPSNPAQVPQVSTVNITSATL